MKRALCICVPAAIFAWLLGSCNTGADNKAPAEKKSRLSRQEITALLDSIYHVDQDIREQLENGGKKNGFKGTVIDSIWRRMHISDSTNLISVKVILDEYGWLGPDSVGEQGSVTLFLVIQHADLKTQQKYLPMMREAVKNKKARSVELALLEDRVALGEGRKQIYGSQFSQNATGRMILRPIEDPDNVDKRRASVGLKPMADHLKSLGIKWDVATYKKQLPEIEEIERSMR